MALSLVAAPSAEPISTAVAKLHCRVDHSTDDALIDTLCAAAREYCETFTGRRCITQTWDLKLDRFPLYDRAIVLPFPPVASITSVSYVDTAGSTQTWSSALYTSVIPAGPQASPAYIVPGYSESYPSTRDVPDAVTVRFVCGYGASATAVPSSLLAAMKLMIGHWYANRESVITGTITAEVPQSAHSLLWPFKVVL